MERQYICSVCKELKNQGFFNHQNKFICRGCEAFGNSLLFNTYAIENDEVVEKSPFTNEGDDRGAFIDYAYRLFGGKLTSHAYAIIPHYFKKYTYLEMARSLEYFYVVKKNDKAKANNGIGIIPYIHEEAQRFYDINNRARKQNYLTNLERIKEHEKSTKVELQVYNKPRQKNSIDLSSL